MGCPQFRGGATSSLTLGADDLGMHLLAQDFETPIWHGWELLDKMRSAKMVSNELVREIYEAMERNGDLTRTWADAKHTTFARVFGGKPG